MSVQPNNKVMMAALTHSYEKTVHCFESATELLQCQWSRFQLRHYSSMSGRTWRSYVDRS